MEDRDRHHLTGQFLCAREALKEFLPLPASGRPSSHPRADRPADIARRFVAGRIVFVNTARAPERYSFGSYLNGSLPTTLVICWKAVLPFRLNAGNGFACLLTGVE